MNRSLTVCIVVLVSIALFGQQERSRLKELIQRFEAFNYYGVIELADNMLVRRPEYTNAELIDILRMKAISHFSILDENSSASGFRELLKLNPDFDLDSVTTSPKIVSFFRLVKTNYLKNAAREETVVKRDTMAEKKSEIPERVSTIYVKPDYFANAKSMLIPGWGQLSLNQNTNTWAYSSAGLLSLGAMVYFIFDCNSKEKDYLNEVDRSNIQSRYDSYNTSYKLRNLSIGAFAVLWLYSQLDLLVLNPPYQKTEQGETLHTSLRSDKYSEYSLHFTFTL